MIFLSTATRFQIRASHIKISSVYKFSYKSNIIVCVVPFFYSKIYKALFLTGFSITKVSAGVLVNMEPPPSQRKRAALYVILLVKTAIVFPFSL